MPQLTLKGLSRVFGSIVAVDDLHLEVPDGALCALLGPSGGGKTTTMRMVAGLEVPDAGEVWLGADDITRLEPRDRRVGMMFQGYALYPHMSVGDNIAYPLRVRSVPRGERDTRINEVAALLGIETLLDRSVQQISGGQQQRVALARAIVQRPELFLLDEPISNLDAALRRTTRNEIRRIQRLLQTTAVVVTHDQLDALSMADLIAVISQGVLQQVGTSSEIYARPANTFVATFIGEPQMNLLPATVARQDDRLGFMLGSHWLPLAPAAAAALAAADGPGVLVGVRPRAVRLHVGGGGGQLPGLVTTVTPEGSRVIYDLAIDDQQIRAESDIDLGVAPGDRALVELRPEAIHLFGAESRQRIN